MQIPIFSKTPDLVAAIQGCSLWKVLLCLKVEEYKTVSKDDRALLLVNRNEFLFNKHKLLLWESVLKTVQPNLRNNLAEKRPMTQKFLATPLIRGKEKSSLC